MLLAVFLLEETSLPLQQMWGLNKAFHLSQEALSFLSREGFSQMSAQYYTVSALWQKEKRDIKKEKKSFW